MTLCSIKGCGRKSHAKGLCNKHYQQLPQSKEYKKNYETTPQMKEYRELQVKSLERKGYKKRYAQDLKTKVIVHYGGKCACCGESNLAFLTIDHVNNDGAEHRKQISSCRGGSRFYQWLIKNNFPEEPKLQVLCWNCNHAKEIYGICPHQKEGDTTCPSNSSLGP